MNKAVLFLFAAFFFANLSYSQQNHFIYIQSDDKQAFTVNVNTAQYTSSEAGYVIIAKLPAAQYNLKISFPGNKYPEQNFVCSVGNADAGYALKNYAEKGWGLFNFQTLELTMAGNTAQTGAKKVDTATARNVFGEMLSDVVDDSTLTKNMVQEKPAEKKPVTAEKSSQKEINTKTTENVAGQAGATELLAPPVAVAVPVVANQETKIDQKKEKETAINKLSDSQAGDNREVVFVVAGKGKPDTVTILIPLESNLEKNKDIVVTGISAAKDSGSRTSPVLTTDNPDVAAPAMESKTDGGVKNPFYVPCATAVSDKTLEKVAANSLDGTDSNKSKVAQEKQAVVKNAEEKDCKKTFSDNDFDKVKHKMFIETNDDKMVEIAKKSFQGKCVTTAQVKNLAILFPSDEGRLKFFNAAFPFVSDASAYPVLKSQLIDPQYKKQFDQYFAK
ncbi:MAG TPA: DUF4476 domain-containing protein [Panacibacter sp.]|nr:DUF4476 domain-containing protein [Panacibacter sp.]HNP45962.1 DUF4476 domain-containing protein [Panacibacter sp.]